MWCDPEIRHAVNDVRYRVGSYGVACYDDRVRGRRQRSPVIREVTCLSLSAALRLGQLMDAMRSHVTEFQHPRGEKFVLRVQVPLIYQRGSELRADPNGSMFELVCWQNSPSEARIQGRPLVLEPVLLRRPRDLPALLMALMSVRRIPVRCEPDLARAKRR